MNISYKIVGIGASAGGLKAITEFFDHIPQRSGMAFVVIQHLSPDFKSMMSELLQKHTKMEIQIVDKPTPISPNNIYLISSLHNVILKNNLLEPIERSDPKSLNLPIDQFFHSLGKERGKNTVGIILSGTGSDGSKGIITIKEAGGVVLVEDPHYAQFDGMPVAALAAGEVDFILPPYALARELMRINSGEKRNKDFLIINPEDSDFGVTFEAVLDEVYLKTGINFNDYRNSTLIRRMEKRMFITKQHDLEAYLKYVRLDPQEVHILQQEFLINVTHFFRDQLAFETMKTQVIPNIIQGKSPHEQIRIWIAACSTGQEALSIAILFKEYLEEHHLTNPLKIFASDIDKSAIAVASEATYNASVLREVPPNLLEKYFEPLDSEFSKYAAVKTLRESIVYAVHDSIYDPPFINMDLVSCRNMMIYLNIKNQKMLLSNFHFALNYKSFLFLGPSESLGDLKKVFKTISTKWNIFQNITEEKVIQPSFKRKKNDYKQSSEPKVTPYSNTLPEPGYSKPLLQDSLYIKLLIEQFAPTCVVVNERLDVLLSNGDIDQVLSFPKVSGNFNLKEMTGTDELIVFKNGIRKCKETKKVTLYENIAFRKRDKTIQLNVKFRPIEIANHVYEEIYIVELLLDENKPIISTIEVVTPDKFRNEKITTIEKELNRVQHEKQLLVQQLETANEELQASNEELLAANEELQSTNEELQSVNEELYTVNTELQNKVNQLITTTNDLDNLLNSTDIGSIFLDQKLNIRRFTPAIKQQFDLLEGDIGRTITTFTNSFVDKSIYPEIEKVVSQLVIFEKEIRDDKGNHYLMRVLPYRTDAGQIDGAVLTFIPINELKRANENLEEAAERYRAVFENSYDNIILINKNGKVDSSNYTFAGYSKDKIVGQSILKVMPKDYREVLNIAMEEVFDGAPSSFFQFENENQNSEKQYFSATITPVIIKDEIFCLALITRNITELKIKELELREMSISLEKQVIERSVELENRNEELSEINSYLDSFVHGAAHDLRAPITQIKGMMQLVPKIKDIAKKEVVFQEVSMCVKRLEKTLNGLIEMIDFQKNNNRTSQKINLLSSFNQVKEQLEKDIEEAEATIKIDIPKKMNINFIQAYITSIFYNLLSNAIKYRSYDKKLNISISAKQDKKFTVILIADNGIGIDLNRYGHFLFQPFKRLTLQREGTGIGLSIINNVVRKNGGRIEVESKLQKGTTFKVFIKSLEHYELSTTKSEEL